MAGDIPSLAQQLGAAVELTMNPSVPMEQRHQVILAPYIVLQWQLFNHITV